MFYDPAIIDPAGTRKPEDLQAADYQALIRAALKAKFPEVEGRAATRELTRLVSGSAAFDLQRRVVDESGADRHHANALAARQRRRRPAAERATSTARRPRTSGRSATSSSPGSTSSQADDALGAASSTRPSSPAAIRASRSRPASGARWSVRSSRWSLTLLLSFPIGVAAAIYLEEFARRNRWTDLIEVNINNLAAVPSIVFGLLGLAVFIGFFGLPRSAPLVGAMVLTLLTLPTIIIASRAALKAVPPSIREAALGMGASKIQMVTHHVLPLAMPGMLTGTIIGMARALGETAPLLMIGMVAFIVDIPEGHHRSRDGAARAGVPVVRQSRARLRREDLGRHHRAAGLPGGHEHDGGHPSQTFRTTVVKVWKRGTSGTCRHESEAERPGAGRAGPAGRRRSRPARPWATSTVDDPIFSCRDVDVYYGEKHAIKKVGIDIAKNQVLAMIGPSGCGKSTFLRCLNRMNDTIPSARVVGSILLDGKDIHDKKQDVVQLRARVGMVFQKPNPFPKSIYENVAYGPRIHGLAGDRVELDEIVHGSLQRAGLWEEVKDRLQHPALRSPAASSSACASRAPSR